VQDRPLPRTRRLQLILRLRHHVLAQRPQYREYTMTVARIGCWLIILETHPGLIEVALDRINDQLWRAAPDRLADQQARLALMEAFCAVYEDVIWRSNRMNFSEAQQHLCLDQMWAVRASWAPHTVINACLSRIGAVGLTHLRHEGSEATLQRRYRPKPEEEDEETHLQVVEAVERFQCLLCAIKAEGFKAKAIQGEFRHFFLELPLKSWCFGHGWSPLDCWRDEGAMGIFQGIFRDRLWPNLRIRDVRYAGYVPETGYAEQDGIVVLLCSIFQHIDWHTMNKLWQAEYDAEKIAGMEPEPLREVEMKWRNMNSARGSTPTAEGHAVLGERDDSQGRSLRSLRRCGV